MNVKTTLTKTEQENPMSTTAEYQQIADLLHRAKTRARSNRRARNQVRAGLRAQLAYRLTSGPSPVSADVLEFMNNLICDLEIATEADAQTTLIANVISNLIAEEAWEQLSGSPRKTLPSKSTS